MNLVNKFLLALALLMLGVIIFKELQYRRWQRYSWSVHISAPERYPMIETLSYFSSPNEDDSYHHFRYPDNKYDIIPTGWGSTSSKAGHMSNSFLPDTLNLSWYSVVEDKHFRGIFTLPLKQIKEQLEQWQESEDKQALRHDIDLIVGLAPGGVVVLWLESRGYSAEIAQFVAEEDEQKWGLSLKPGLAGKTGYLDSLIHDFTINERTTPASAQLIPYGVWQRPAPSYPWLGVYDAPEEYPVKAVYCRFFTLEGRRIRPANADEWQPGDGLPSIHPEYISHHTAPSALSLSWVSPCEQKIYEGTLELPAAYIASLMRGSNWFTWPWGRITSCSWLVAEMAEGGFVNVRLQKNGKLHKIGRYAIAQSSGSYQQYLADEHAEFEAHKEEEEAQKAREEAAKNRDWDNYEYRVIE